MLVGVQIRMHQGRLDVLNLLHDLIRTLQHRHGAMCIKYLHILKRLRGALTNEV